ncbi:hypothetical protein GGR52DRAFT_494309 [Hypoxylon sp. FL1284]|nr:hypothetical protein GGR52DRAFT_494309 [Hypoxylon sp. FL1284]
MGNGRFSVPFLPPKHPYHGLPTRVPPRFFPPHRSRTRKKEKAFEMAVKTAGCPKLTPKFGGLIINSFPPHPHRVVQHSSPSHVGNPNPAVTFLLPDIEAVFVPRKPKKKRLWRGKGGKSRERPAPSRPPTRHSSFNLISEVNCHGLHGPLKSIMIYHNTPFLYPHMSGVRGNEQGGPVEVIPPRSGVQLPRAVVTSRLHARVDL